MNILHKPRWSPYLVGALIGVLSWVTFAWMGKALGTSTTMVRASGAIVRTFAPEQVAENAYFAKYLGTPQAPKPTFDWQFALVVAMVIGAFLAARLGESRFRETVPTLWAERFGESRALRLGAAFLGGAVMLFGARLAGGCTSGHAISGALQLSLSSWLFLGSMFASGIATAFALYGKGGQKHAG